METQKVHEIVIDFKQIVNMPLAQFVQEDSNVIRFVIKDGGIDADLSNIGRIVVNIERPDKEIVSRQLTAIGNVITYVLGLEEQEKSGRATLELQFFSKDNMYRISTKRFYIMIHDSVGKMIEAGKGLTLFQKLFVEIEDIRESEASRKDNESARVVAETERSSEEVKRKSEETSRVSAETSRVDAENARATSENTRKSNESTRQSNETTRQNQESTRQSQEQIRQDQELARQNSLSTALNTIDEKITEVDSEVQGVIQEATQATNNTINATSSYVEVVEKTKLNYLPYIDTYAAIATTYPNPQIGDMTQVIDSKIQYRFNGIDWVPYGVGEFEGVGVSIGQTNPLNTNLIWIETEGTSKYSAIKVQNTQPTNTNLIWIDIQ